MTPRVPPTPSEYLGLVSAAETSTADRQWATAARLWRRVVETNPTNGDHWDRLASALYESGEPGDALRAYEKVLQLGVSLRQELRDSYWPGAILYKVACCHARLGHEAEAIKTLSEAVAAGLRDIRQPFDDEAWAAFRDHERVRALLGLFDTENVSREEGWRQDLELFSRELKRRAPDPWQEMSEADFDNSVASLSGEVAQLSDTQITARLLALLRRLGDGHARLAPPADSPDCIALPLKFYIFGEDTYIVAASPGNAELVGSQLLGVGGRTLETIWAGLDPVVCRDNAQQLKLMAPELLRWTPLVHALGLIDHSRGATLDLLSADGRERTVTVSSMPVGSTEYPDLERPHGPLPPRPEGWVCLPERTGDGALPLYLRHTGMPYWFEHLSDHGVTYLQFNEARDHPAESFAAFCDRAFSCLDNQETPRLVVDLRWNGGGNTPLSLALLHHIVASRALNEWGNLFVVIGRATFSAAQNLATLIERHTKAIFVGEPTGSRPNFIGETAPFELPYSRTEVNVSDLSWQSSWPSDRRPWVPPEIYAPPNFADYRASRDPALEAILSLTGRLPGC